MGEKEDLQFLLQPKNQIVKVVVEHTAQNGNQKILALDKDNLENFIKPFIQEESSTSNVPIVFFSVLGNNNKNLRELYTDWLIHYCENFDKAKEETTDQFYKSWKPNYRASDQLNYIGQCTEPGVYLWPTPLRITEEISTGEKKGQQQELLGLILYSHGLGGEHWNPECNVLFDYLVACATQKTVVFKEREKENLTKFVKVMNGDTIPPFTSFLTLSKATAMAMVSSIDRSVMEKGLDEFLTSLRITKDKKFILKSEGIGINLPTLTNIVAHLEKITTSMNEPSEAASQLILTAITKETSTGKPENDKVTPRKRPAPQPPAPDPKVQAFRTDFQRWLTEDIKLPEKESKKIVQDLGMERWTRMMESLNVLQKILQGYNLELQNTFDNYVCFSGSIDEKQIEKFQEAARKREEINWNATQIKNDSQDDHLIVDKLRTKITQWLSELCFEENNEIIKKENQLGETVLEMLKEDYVTKMQTYLMEENGGKLKLSEAHVIHARIVRYLCSAMNRCMDFGGKLNNVVTIKMTRLEQALDDKFGDWMKENKFFEDKVTKSNENEIISKYINEIESKIPQCAAAVGFKNLHDFTFAKLTNGWQGKDRDDLESKLLSYLVYSSESYLEQLQFSSSGNDAPTMCIYLGADWISATVRETDGWRVIKFDQPNGSSQESMTTRCPARVSLINSKLHMGYYVMPTTNSNGKAIDMTWEGENTVTVFNCIRLGLESQLQPKLEMATSILKAIYELLWKLGGVEIVGGQVVVIVPSWFSIVDRAVLRKSASAAGLKNTFLVNESSLAAYHLLTENKGKLVCVVLARTDTVRVEIFEGTDSITAGGKGISLLAIASGGWTEKIDPDKPPKVFLQVFKETYERAVSQLSMDKKGMDMVCFLQTDHPGWKKHLVVSLEAMKLVVKEGSTEKYFVDTAAWKLCLDPGKIRELLLDYATPKRSVNDTDSSTKLSANQEEILRKCQAMEGQLNTKEVRLGVIMKRIVMETIERARLNVRTNQDTQKDEVDLAELINTHKFKV